MRQLMRGVVCLGLVAAAAPVSAQECMALQGSGAHVRTSGSALLRLPPDRVSFSVGVETFDANVSRAFRSNAQKVEGVLNALKAKGVQAKELQTSDLEVSSRNPDGSLAQGYRVRNRVTVSRESAEGVGDLIETAIAAGANDAGRLNFFVANPDTAQARGLGLAFASARAKAETLAALSHRTLGDVLCVLESFGDGYAASNMLRGGIASSGSVESGSEAIPFGVVVVFALK